MDILYRQLPAGFFAFSVSATLHGVPKPFHLFPQRVNVQPTATPATPVLSYLYFTLPVAPRG